ncbi:MAG: HAD hydrolase family protein [Deltaproteobacteria bacterium]|nr:MAG: HAD hydrolase family protein [Deltaproteobacteria bacterium]
MHKPFPALSQIHTIAFDFDGVFTDNKVWVGQDGYESVRCDRSDGLAFDLVRVFQKKKKLNAELFILSKESNPVVLMRARKLKLKCYHSVGDKLAFMQGYLKKRFPLNLESWKGLVYLGNDLNDLLLMRYAGYAVAPADAHPKIAELAHLVLKQKGGEGFVRAFIERLLGINKLSKEKIDELISNC